MHFTGITIGIVAFILIGVFHPIVIKSEYYFGTRVWPVFLATGIGSLVLSVFIAAPLPAAAVGVFGCSALWSIKELFEQAARVQKGWFPKNPKRKHGE